MRELKVQPGVAWSGFPRGTRDRAMCPRTTSRRHSWGVLVLHPKTSGLAVSSGGLEADREATVGLDTKRPCAHFAASWRFPQDLLTTAASPAPLTPPHTGLQLIRGPSSRSKAGRALRGCLPDGTGIARPGLECVKTPTSGVLHLRWPVLLR
jgi:hypothetical protein